MKKLNTNALTSFPESGTAIILGSSGGIGSAVLNDVIDSGRFAHVVGLHRKSEPAFDLTDESSIAAAARHVAQLESPLRLIFLATGILQDEQVQPEKNWRQLDASWLARSFAVNAIGPALVIKHFLPQMARTGKSVFAALSAKVGSIGDNRLGGWYGYRASKAALNQLIHTAAIELGRQRPDAVCVVLHPGTVDTGLSEPHSKTGLNVRQPAEAAVKLLGVVDRLTPEHTGGFFDYQGESLPW